MISKVFEKQNRFFQRLQYLKNIKVADIWLLMEITKRSVALPLVMQDLAKPVRQALSAN
jgi:hypothetical protein